MDHCSARFVLTLCMAFDDGGIVVARVIESWRIPLPRTPIMPLVSATGGVLGSPLVA